MLKALSVAALTLMPSVAFAQDWGSFYAEVYGGSRLAGDSTYYDTHDIYPLDPGYAAGLTLGVQTQIDGLAVELDIMRTDAPYDSDNDFSLGTTSIMAGAQYTAMLNDMFGLYVGGGVGIVHIGYENLGVEAYGGNGLGYQAQIGAIANVTDSVSIFAELKKQDTFTYVDLLGDDVSSPSLNALVGLRFTMN